MAKKSRRTRHQQRPRPTPSAAPVQATQEPERTSSASVNSSTSNQRKEVDFRAEYPYVIQDLRSMGIIAAGMLGVLIALSFIIH
jgi:hypothetical protein